MKKMIMHIVGNRPQFIKLAALEREIKKRGYEQIIVHTGQHYDKNMSDIFFEELEISKPTVNLGVGSGTHAQMTGNAILKLERVIGEYKPTCVILYGDTDSTLAGAITTCKTGIPIVHIEAGVRTGNKNNPEEINRIVTDHVAEILLCSDKIALQNLEREGLAEKSHFVGDVMYDTFLRNRGRRGKGTEILKKYGLTEREYVLMTWHRQENTSDAQRMHKILDFIEQLDIKVICPLHPRTRKRINEFGLENRVNEIKNLVFIDPVGYLDMVELMSHSYIIVTDSGGVSKESFFAGVKCIQMFGWTLWPDLEEINWIYRENFDDSFAGVLDFFYNHMNDNVNSDMKFYGDGTAAIKIVDILEESHLV